MSALRAKILEKIVAYATLEVLGKDRSEPRDQAEEDELLDRIRRYKDRLLLLDFVKPVGHKLYYKKQDVFLRTRAPVKIFCGSNQSGKTLCLAAELLSWALGEYLWSGEKVLDLKGKPVEPPIRIFWGAKSFTMAHTEVTMPKLNELLPLEALGIEVDKQQGRSAHRIRFPSDLGGSTIKFQSYDQDSEDYEGTTWHIAGFDEPPPRHAYIGTKRGCMKHQAPIVFSFTPLKEPWIFDEIYNSPKAVHLSEVADTKKLKKNSFAIVDVDLEDSPFLSRAGKDEFVASLDSEEVEARAHGRWVHLLGRVYKDFSRDKHVLDTAKWFELNPDWKTYTTFMVVDPHDRRPFACTWGVVTPRQEMIFIDEWPNQPFHKMKQWNNDVGEYVKLFAEKEKSLGIESINYRLMDPNFGVTPKAGTGLTISQAFDDNGLAFDTNIDDELTSGHAVVRQSLREGTIFWLDRCYNGITAMLNYTWDEFRAAYGNQRMPKDKPRDLFKDFADLPRYAKKFGVTYISPGEASAWMFPKGFTDGGMARSRW